MNRLNKIRYLICFNGSVLVAIIAVVMIIGDTEKQLLLIPITLFTVWMILWAKHKIDKHPKLYGGA
jgi:hypothetical protein